MPRRIVSSLVFLAATVGLVWAGWPGRPADPATLINRVDVVAAVMMLAGLPWLARRVVGPAGDSWLARTRLPGMSPQRHQVTPRRSRPAFPNPARS
jgi:hypothetical protein